VLCGFGEGFIDLDEGEDLVVVLFIGVVALAVVVCVLALGCRADAVC